MVKDMAMGRTGESKCGGKRRANTAGSMPSSAMPLIKKEVVVVSETNIPCQVDGKVINVFRPKLLDLI